MGWPAGFPRGVFSGALSAHHEPTPFDPHFFQKSRKSRLLRCIEAIRGQKAAVRLITKSGFQTHLCGAPVIKTLLLIPLFPASSRYPPGYTVFSDPDHWVRAFDRSPSTGVAGEELGRVHVPLQLADDSAVVEPEEVSTIPGCVADTLTRLVGREVR